jgi:hypothetical protein
MTNKTAVITGGGCGRPQYRRQSRATRGEHPLYLAHHPEKAESLIREVEALDPFGIPTRESG